MIWACLRFIVDEGLLARTINDPVVLLAAPAGILYGLLAVIILGGLACLVGTVMPARDGAGPLVAFSLAVVAWAATGGTIDDWLIYNHKLPGPGTSGPYLKLLADYAALAGIAAVLAGLFGYDGRPHGPDDRPSFAAALNPRTVTTGNGPLHLLVAVVVAIIVLYLLAGPAAGRTYHGQVYFGVAVACAAGTSAARSIAGLPHALWTLAVPFVVGLVGLSIAAARPVLPGDLAQLDVFPPWGGLARPLPVEMIGVGIVAVTATRRILSRPRQA